MLVNCDAKALEWVCALYFSQDPTGIKEYLDGVDVHSANQAAFDLPSRLIAKTYLFRLIYGGSAYSYAHDPNFADASTSERYWQEVIDRTYLKYKGLGQWHTKLMQEVVNTGRLVMPTGRVYSFKRMPGEDFPRTQILNYPVQGLGADLMSIARASLFRRMHRANLKSLLVCTVHDSILTDGPKAEAKKVCQLMNDVFRDIPSNFKRVFGVEFNLPVRCEISIGDSWGEMNEVNEEYLNAD
jgi:DNA polymerase I-like protein with 3'-5' exonuclease and polymerase domains